MYWMELKPSVIHRLIDKRLAIVANVGATTVIEMIGFYIYGIL